MGGRSTPKGRRRRLGAQRRDAEGGQREGPVRRIRRIARGTERERDRDTPRPGHTRQRSGKRPPKPSSDRPTKEGERRV
jgi:hypothetical protein